LPARLREGAIGRGHAESGERAEKDPSIKHASPFG
jgi:hypothetical protein